MHVIVLLYCFIVAGIMFSLMVYTSIFCDCKGSLFPSEEFQWRLVKVHMYVYACVMLLKSAFYCRVVAQPLLKTSWFQLQDENGTE